MGRLLKRLPTFTLRIFGDHVNNRCVQLEAALCRMISVCHERITRAIRKQNDLSNKFLSNKKKQSRNKPTTPRRQCVPGVRLRLKMAGVSHAKAF